MDPGRQELALADRFLFPASRLSLANQQMKLATKLVLLFLVCLAFVVSAFSFLSIRQAKRIALEDHELHAKDLAASLELAVKSNPLSQEQLNVRLAEWSEMVDHVAIRILNRSDSSWRTEVEISRQVVTYRAPDQHGNPRIYSYLPMQTKEVESQNAKEIQLEISVSESFWGQQLADSLKSAGIGLTVAALVSSVVILYGGYRMVALPLKKMLERVKEIGEGNLSCSLQVDRDDELGELSAAINAMCSQLSEKQKLIEEEASKKIAAQEQLRHADRLKTVGRLAAGLAHELGTPLNVVSGRADLIASGRLDQKGTRESALAIQTQTDRISKIVRQLLDFSRQGNSHKEIVDICALVRTCLDLLSTLADKGNVSLEMPACRNRPHVSGNPSQLQQVISNLVVNAIQASQDGDTVNLEVVSDEDGEGVERRHFVRVVVRDRGVGIDVNELENIFDPFFTTKDTGEGTGLGLSISNNIVREHDGRIEVKSEQGVGTTFVVYLPRADDNLGEKPDEQNK